jgi:hypothetical protein
VQGKREDLDIIRIPLSNESSRSARGVSICLLIYDRHRQRGEGEKHSVWGKPPLARQNNRILFYFTQGGEEM